ncbi:Arginine kinase Pro [Pseudolycoriella hygida]|uniref:Arginine kinase Pro n=1 Tax=Pseudolycoriella hygida TaxID=35572 RepID=A0A9Q0MJ26_9DIPT|nr:Arginine kinase Pro [Pseudolycoriella hygida]
MYSLDSEDTLKDDSEATTVANEKDETEEPNEEMNGEHELIEDRKPVQESNEDEEVLEGTTHAEEEDEEADAENNDENNNENEFDPNLNDEDVASEEIKALTNDDEETHEEEENGSYKEDHGDQDDDDDEQGKEISPSPAMEINGVVTGEPDDGVVQSEGGQIPIDDESDEHDDESKIQNIINSGDMEQLAALVLNGKGLKLIGKSSSSPEIQAFLDNVSAYMNKIRRVHLAAREGSLRDLQSALDRRKFAIAKDDISPDGCSPLHVATVFGHAGIIRYLAGRFPETMAAVDGNGRTALHYAATVNDNGHFFNLLSHLGSNPKAEDNMGHSAEFYTNHEQSDSVLSHRMILKGFGAEEQLADDMLNDQVPDDLHSARRLLDDADTLSTLERCFRLIHLPGKPMHALELPTNSVPGSASSLRTSITTYLARFLKRSIFDKIKLRQSRMDHNLFDLIWPAMKKKERKVDEDLNAGVVIPDFDVLVVFQEFLVPLIKDIHCIDANQDFKPHPKSDFFEFAKSGENGKEDVKEINFNLDESGRWITEGLVECARNLEKFELPINLNTGQLEDVEQILTSKIMTPQFTKAIAETEIGTYYTMNEILESQSEIRTILAATGLLIPLLDINDPYQLPEASALNGQHYPYGRGVYVTQHGNMAIWINAQDHLRVLCCTETHKPGNIGIAYSKIARAMIYLDEVLRFRHSYFLGYLSSRPSFLGTSLRLTLRLDLPHLSKERENLRHLCTVRSIHMITDHGSAIKACNMQSIGLTEWQLFQDYCTAIANIVGLEKDLSMIQIYFLDSRSNAVEIPLFRTEEGRYLATTLGDPLIKGLTEVANSRPTDPIAFLANYLNGFSKQRTMSTNTTDVVEDSKSASPVKAERKASVVETNSDLDEPPATADGPELASSSDDRDEHGQSLLHFACARSHARNGLIQLIEESKVSITFRDELYRTARDVSLQASHPDNAREIDRYILGFAARGELDFFENLVLDGYDHIVDITDKDGNSITKIAETRGQQNIVDYLSSVKEFEENREKLHRAIRESNLDDVVDILSKTDGLKLAKSKNYFGRCAAHVAVLKENEEIVDYIASKYKQSLRVGDNLERTPLHYAMGLSSVETLSRILIKNGAKRVLKDLKGRQPSYYFMNKSDILRLQEEEQEHEEEDANRNRNLNAD